MRVEVEPLREALKGAPAGELAGPKSGEVTNALWRTWNHLGGSRDGGIRADKLNRPIESMTWAPSLLRFQIERHGAIVGEESIRAELQRWCVDVE